MQRKTDPEKFQTASKLLLEFVDAILTASLDQFEPQIVMATLKSLGLTHEVVD